VRVEVFALDNKVIAGFTNSRLQHQRHWSPVPAIRYVS